jgi:hypothetical protein
MKLVYGVLALLTISCGGQYPQSGRGSSSVGELRSLEMVPISQIERANLTSVCSALAQKSSYLNSALGSTFSFQTSQSDCSGNLISSGLVNVVLQGSGADYFFRRTDGTNFIFPDIETPTVGMMDRLCDSSNISSNPVQQGNNRIYFSIQDSFSDCPAVANELCVRVERASVVGTSAVVDTVDLMRVRLPQGGTRYGGFFTFRKRVARSFCATNEFVSQEAVLK